VAPQFLFAVVANNAYSVLTLDNTKQPDVAFVLCRELHPDNKYLGGLHHLKHPTPFDNRIFAIIIGFFMMNQFQAISYGQNLKSVTNELISVGFYCCQF
jgi:hypothetical protein